MAALDPAPHRNRLSTKNTPNTIPGTREAVMMMLVFQRNPPMTNGGERVGRGRGRGKERGERKREGRGRERGEREGEKKRERGEGEGGGEGRRG